MNNASGLTASGGLRKGIWQLEKSSLFLFLTYHPAAVSSKLCLTQEFSSLLLYPLLPICFISAALGKLYHLPHANWTLARYKVVSKFLVSSSTSTNCRGSKILLLSALSIFNKRFFFPPETPERSWSISRVSCGLAGSHYSLCNFWQSFSRVSVAVCTPPLKQWFVLYDSCFQGLFWGPPSVICSINHSNLARQIKKQKMCKNFFYVFLY